MNIPTAYHFILYILAIKTIFILITINTPSINLNKAKYKPIKIIHIRIYTQQLKTINYYLMLVLLFVKVSYCH